MIIVPMYWLRVPADSIVIMPDGRHAHVSGQIDAFGGRLIDGVPDYLPSVIVPVIQYSDAEMGVALATLARHFRIEAQ